MSYHLEQLVAIALQMFTAIAISHRIKRVTTIALIRRKAIAIKAIGAGIIAIGGSLFDRLAAIIGLNLGILIGCFGTVWVVSEMRSPHNETLPVVEV